MARSLLVLLAAMSVMCVLVKSDRGDYDDYGDRFEDRFEDRFDDYDDRYDDRNDDRDDRYDDRSRNKRADYDDRYDDRNDDRDDRYDDKISSEDAALNARLKRAVLRGAFRENSNKRRKYHRQSFTHQMSTNPEGEVSIDTKHHHEKGKMAEESNKSGLFTLHNRHGGSGGQGWFDDDHDGGLNVY